MEASDENQSPEGAISDVGWRIYLALWERVKREGVTPMYVGPLPGGQSGLFVVHERPNIPDRPVIQIVRSHYENSREPTKRRNAGGSQLGPPDLEGELITIAHELGHVCSWKAGNRTPALIAAASKVTDHLSGNAGPLDDGEKEIVRAEETRAWQYARSVLTELGFTDWKTFDAREAKGLFEYERIFSGEVFRND